MLAIPPSETQLSKVEIYRGRLSIDMQVSLDQDGTCFGGKCVVGIGRCNQ